MTSLMKWQHFSCLGLYLQLLSFLNIRKLAISAQVTLHISNAIVNMFRLCPPCIPAGRTQVSRAFIAARCYNSFTLPNSERHTQPICVGLLFVLLTKKKKKLWREWQKLTSRYAYIAVAFVTAVWCNHWFANLSAGTALHRRGVGARTCLAMWPRFTARSVICAAAPVEQLKVLLLRRLFGHLCCNNCSNWSITLHWICALHNKIFDVFALVCERVPLVCLMLEADFFLFSFFFPL